MYITRAAGTRARTFSILQLVFIYILRGHIGAAAASCGATLLPLAESHHDLCFDDMLLLGGAIVTQNKPLNSFT